MRITLALTIIIATVAATTAAAQDAQPTAEADHDAHLLALVREAGSDVHWIRDPYAAIDSRRDRRRPRPMNPALDRNVLLDRALARAKAENRIVLVYAFRIQGPQMYRWMLLDDYMNLTVFSDPETVALINRKFIPLRLYVDHAVAPRLGIGNRRNDERYLAVVEPALIFVAPDGEVLHTVQRIRTFSAEWARSLLVGLLARHPQYAKPSALTAAIAKAEPKKVVDRLAYARELLLDGDHGAAGDVLSAAMSEFLGDFGTALGAVNEHMRQSDPSPGAQRRGKALLRRLQQQRRLLVEWIRVGAMNDRLAGTEPDDALREVMQTLESTETPMSEAVLLERGRLLLAAGRWAEARTALAKAPVTSQSAYLSGVASWREWRIPEALASFRRAVQLGQAPWHRQAAAMLVKSDDTTPLSPLAHACMMVKSPGALSADLPTTTERTGVARATVVRDAFDFLLAQQHPSGAWTDARYAYWPSPKIIPNVRVAITALAATAVLEWRSLDPARADAALQRAEAFLARDENTAMGTEEEVYAQAYRAIYWIRRARATPELAARAKRELERIAKHAGRIQNAKTGFFAHEYANAFCTAAMGWSLHQAAAMGADVDPSVLDRTVGAVASARRPDGTFTYGGSYRARPGRRTSEAVQARLLKDSMARMPHCEGFLFVRGKSHEARVATAFDNFLTYLDRLATVRKCDYHSDGELGGFFFWHALFHASEAKGLLEESKRRVVEARLAALVTSIQEIDGSFVDSHEFGKSYGTAMALLVLRSLSSARDL